MKNKKIIIISAIVILLLALVLILFNLKGNKVPLKELTGIYTAQEITQDDKGNPTIYIIKLTIEDSKKITLEESDSYKYEKTIGTYKYSKDTITYKRESLVEIEDEKDKITEYNGENLTSKIKVIDSHNLRYTYKSKELLLTKM